MSTEPLAPGLSPGKPSPRPATWKLNVQGVVLDYDVPYAIASEAMRRAGFTDIDAWHIYLQVPGQPKREIPPDFRVDLSGDGVEKIRLVERQIDNGEARAEGSRDFQLLPADVKYLNSLGLRWETVIDEGRRWLLIHDFPVPHGYTVDRVQLAIEVPTGYPGAQLDSFHAYLPLALASGAAIPATQLRATIRGIEFHGWSRHRNAANQWDPNSDSVATHLALVETAIEREVSA